MNKQNNKLRLLLTGYYYLKNKESAKNNRVRRLWVHPLVAEKYEKRSVFYHVF